MGNLTLLLITSTTYSGLTLVVRYMTSTVPTQAQLMDITAHVSVTLMQNGKLRLLKTLVLMVHS